MFIQFKVIGSDAKQYSYKDWPLTSHRGHSGHGGVYRGGRVMVWQGAMSQFWLIGRLFAL